MITVNKKLVFAVFIGLLASITAIIGSLFLLQEQKKMSSIPERVNAVQQSLNDINTQIDLTDVRNDINSLSDNVNSINSDLDAVKASQDDVLQYIDGGSTTPEITQENKEEEENQTNNNNNETESTNEADKSVAKTKVRLNLRNAPGTDSDVMKTLVAGAEVEVMGEEKVVGDYTWIKVKDDEGHVGYVASNFTN